MTLKFNGFKAKRNFHTILNFVLFKSTKCTKINTVRIFVTLQYPPFPTNSASLSELKSKILENLKVLEKEGLVSSSKNYQEILDAIARVRIICRVPCSFFFFFFFFSFCSILEISCFVLYYGVQEEMHHLQYPMSCCSSVSFGMWMGMLAS